MATCRSCSQPIIWCKTPDGRHMPVDPIPSEDGNVEVDEAGVARVVGVLGQQTLPLGHRYKSHFATCPQADSWRKAR